MITLFTELHVANDRSRHLFMKDTNDHQQFCDELWDATEQKFLIRPLSLITHGYCFSIVKVFYKRVFVHS